MQKIFLSLIIGCLSTLLFSSCGETQPIYVITPANVNFQINTNSVDKDLAIPANIKTFTSPRLGSESVGRSGLLVVCSSYMNNNGDYNLYAYDLCCPNEDKIDVRVVPDQKTGTAKCNVCGSVYDVLNGFGTTPGPSKNSLQRYSVSYAGTKSGVFRITR